MGGLQRRADHLTARPAHTVGAAQAGAVAPRHAADLCASLRSGKVIKCAGYDGGRS